MRQTSYEESRVEGGGGFGRGSDTRRQGWNENRFECYLVQCTLYTCKCYNLPSKIITVVLKF